MRKNNSRKSDFVKPEGIIMIMFAVVTLFYVSFLFYEKEQSKDEAKEARSNGIETTALVMDKNVEKRFNGKTHYTDYYVKFYSLKEEFVKEVRKVEYDQVNPGDYIEVVVKEEKILFGSKEDQNETIRIVDEE